MSSNEMLSLTRHNGNIFAAPERTVLIHACNTQGSWGSGIALAFKQDYPNAFKVYHAHCISKTNHVQTGTCLLIEPCEIETRPKHWIACLFTSARYGRAKDSKEKILVNTRLAVEDLLEQVEDIEAEGEEVGALRMCKINSGKFGVEWERTEKVVKNIETKGHREAIEVWDREANLADE